MSKSSRKARKTKIRVEPKLEVDRNQEVAEVVIERNRQKDPGQETEKNRVGEVEVEIEKLVNDQKVEIVNDQNHVIEKKSKDRKRSRSKEKSRKKSRSRSPRKSRKKSRSRSKSIDRMHRKRTPSPKDKASIEERDSRTVLAMQLSQKTREKDLKDFFSAVGDVKAVKLIQSLSKRQKNIGIAYIEFKFTQSVPLAIGLSGQPLNGVPIIVQQSLAEKNRHAQMMETTRANLSKLGSGPIKLKVSNLPDELTEDMVRQIFDPFGTIESCLLISDPITKKFTGSGFVTFTETECGKAAMRELDRFDLAGNRLKVSVVDGSSSRERRSDRRDERRRSSERSEGSDPANGAVGRIALMAKLAHREPAAPKPVEKPNSKPSAPAQQPIETTCFQLSNMFNPTTETGKGWDGDIRDDVILEMIKYGGAVHVYVDKHSKDGIVYVKGHTRESAMLATKAIHGRYFDGKMIQAAYIPEVNYVELFPDAATATAPLKPN